MLNIKLNGFVIPATAAHTINQAYFPVGPQNLVRFMDGGSAMQETYSKIGTIITGKGWVPPALEALPYSTEMVVSCIKPKALPLATNVGQLPAARRTDAGFNPVGYAVVNGDLVETDVAISVNTATLTAVAGATSYQVQYYPELSMRVFRPDVSLDAALAEYDWSITAEEV